MPSRRAVLAMGVAGLALVAGGDAASAGERIRQAAVIAAHRRYGDLSRDGVRPAVPGPFEPPGLRPPIPARARAAHHVQDVLPQAPANAVALTIDDGPTPEWTPKVLDLLDAQGVTATFSLIGIQVRQFPKLAQRISEAGHTLCNHTMHHPLRIARLSPSQIATEILDAHKLIADATGVAPAFFRSPGGSWSPSILDAAAQGGMVPIDWDVDPRDWSRPGVDHITRTMLNCRAGDILLCHDGGGDRSETLRALGTVIPALKKRGLAFSAL